MTSLLLRLQVDEAMLKSFFETTYGPVVECKLIMDKQTGNSKGYLHPRLPLGITVKEADSPFARYGFVTFVSPETAAQVKQQGSIPFMGKNVNALPQALSMRFCTDVAFRSCIR